MRYVEAIRRATLRMLSVEALVHTRRAVGILSATLALVAAAPGTAAAVRPVGVAFERRVATLPTQAYPTVDLLHQDADGAIVVSRGREVMRFSPSGELVARWALPPDLVAASRGAI
jgi:hypothetical protein